MKPLHLPKSNVLSFGLENNAGLIIRPSGTEPLVRVMAEAATQAYADEVCTRLAKIVAEELAL